MRTERADFLVECLNLPEASGVDTARWEPYQLAHLQDDSTFRIEDKSRQIAWSFTVAAEAVADGLLTGAGTVFVSINLDEAMEKIRYARQVYENLDVGGLPKLVRDNDLSLEFDNGARLLSLPSRPPRGKARMNVVLDEFAHVQHDRDIYKAALPIISKGGRLRIGSSPLGASGVFWELFTESLQKYPGYSRRRTPWWEVQAFCRDVRQARGLAPGMQTAERVDAFGAERIQAIYANMLEEDFQQEYEGEFVDESSAWITWEVIQRNQAAFQAAGMRHWHARSVDGALALVDDVLEAVARGAIEPAMTGGIDVGRKHDLSEMMALGMTTTNQFPVRLMVSLSGVPYDDQETCFRQVISRLPFTQVLIDRNGIGAQLAENLERATGRAQGVDFTNQSKQLWAVEARIQAERGNTPLPPDRDLAYQIHSIKKKVTAAKNNVFDTERNEKHHADKFWAWALAIWAASGGGVASLQAADSPLSGYRG
jgi:phage FluMu gp28-like protein